ncbi:PD-(D/E)XK nuclease family protein [Dermabacteraceae bacterium TAE3-ERU27]|nr:PD-(D/E)XK nuclease family protein [Dermabacteraceae bacterium TAE3-ERU27]
MTTPKLSADTPRGRMYRIEPEGPLLYPSITTVSGMRHKEFLQTWYASMAGKKALEMFEFLSRNPHRAEAEIRRVVGRKWETQKKIAAAASDYTQKAADFGTLVHALCEDFERDLSMPTRQQIAERATAMREGGAFANESSLSDLCDRVQVRLDGFADFVRDFAPEFVEIEQTVVNHTVGYAGTTDCIVSIGGALLSGDIKTSKRVHGDYALQAVAVVNAEALLDDDGTQRPMPDLAGGFIIHLPEKGGYSVVPLKTGEEEMAVFKGLRSAWGFLEDDAALKEVSEPKQLLLSLLTAKNGVGLIA